MKNIVFAAVALFAVSASANEALMELDLDKDGAISQEEAANVEGMSDAFATLDANADGKLDEAEFAMFEEVQPVAVEVEAAEVTEEATGAVESAVEATETAVEAVTDEAAKVAE